MDFGSFLGNDALKQRLSTAVSAGKMSHSYILSGPEGSGKHTLADLLAAAMECTSSGEKPCRVCPQCRKVFSHSHPDVIIVDDTEHKNVGVGLSRWAKSDLYIRPNEGKKKIYLFPRAQDMNEAAQNALLKVMEEPPAYGAFILLTQSAGKLLSTIRSRCVELSLSPVEQKEALIYLAEKFPKEDAQTLRSAYRRSGGFLGQAEELLQNGATLDERAVALAEACARRDVLALTQTLSKMEKIKREALLLVLHQLQALVAEAISAKAEIAAVTPSAVLLSQELSAARLMTLYKDLQQAVESAEANVGAGHICGFLAVRLHQQS